MQTRVQKIGNEFVVMLPTQIAEDLHLVEGSLVELHRVDDSGDLPSFEIRHLSDEQARAFFEEIEPLHRNTFHELAK